MITVPGVARSRAAWTVRSGASGDPSAPSFPVGLTASVIAGSGGADGAGCPGVAVAVPETRFTECKPSTVNTPTVTMSATAGST
jgi:hypothetical protein